MTALRLDEEEMQFELKRLAWLQTWCCPKCMLFCTVGQVLACPPCLFFRSRVLGCKGCRAEDLSGLALKKITGCLFDYRLDTRNPHDGWGP